VRIVGTLAAGGLLQVVAGLSPLLAVLLVLVLPMAVVESVPDPAGTAVLPTGPPPHLRGRLLGVWSSIGTVWGLGGRPPWAS
jgi:MFS family permease